MADPRTGAPTADPPPLELGPRAFLTTEALVGTTVVIAVACGLVVLLVTKWLDGGDATDLVVAAAMVVAGIAWAVFALRFRVTVDSAAIRRRHVRTTTFALDEIDRAVAVEEPRFPRRTTVVLIEAEGQGTALCTCRDPDTLVAAIARSKPGGFPPVREAAETSRPPDMTVEPPAATTVSIVAVCALVALLGVLHSITSGRAPNGPAVIAVGLLTAAALGTAAARVLRDARSPIDIDPSGVRPRRRGAPAVPFLEVDQIVAIRPDRRAGISGFAAITGNRGRTLPIPESARFLPGRRDEERRAIALALSELVEWGRRHRDDGHPGEPAPSRLVFNEHRPTGPRLRSIVLVSGLVVVLAATALWIRAITAVHQETLDVRQRAVTTEATVVDRSTSPSGRVTLTLRYDTRQGTRTDTMISPRRDAELGDVVTIEVDPEQPDWIWTADDPVTELAFDQMLVLVALLLPLAYGYASLFTFWCLWHPHRRASATRP